MSSTMANINENVKQPKRNRHHQSSSRITKKDNNDDFVRNIKKLFILFISTSLIAFLIYLYKDELFTVYERLNTGSNSNSFLNRNASDSAKPFGGYSFPLGNMIGDGPTWGTLSSGQYFGQKISAPLAFEAGLMWFDNKLNEYNRLNIRHLCHQDDRLKSYSWLRHDFYNFGEQLIQDDDFKLQTIYLRDEENPLQWSAKINLLSENSTRAPISLIYYITKDRIHDKIDLATSRTMIEAEDRNGNINLAEIRGNSKETGNFLMSIDISSNHDKFIYGNFLRLNFDKLRYPLADICHAHLLRTRHDGNLLYIMPGNKEIPGLQDTPVDDPNFVAYQLVLKPSASFTITFSQQPIVQSANLDTTKFDALHEQYKSMFDSKFNSLFLNKLESNFPNDSKLVEMSKIALSNMIGSIGYFHGKSYIMNENDPEKIVAYGPIQLLTAVPSRSFFPRGFLWDEGFHNILISTWDPKLSTTIIKSWFNIMNVDGWIPREVILGIENLRRVPKEFIVQKTSNANPPAMIIPIEHMLDRNELNVDTLRELYPRLKAWFNWFNTTQTGDLYSTFRWRGRDQESDSMLNPKTLTSGFDDYPRASQPSEEEYHLDLRCWIAVAARTMAKISKKLNDEAQYKYFHDQYQLLSNNQLLEKLHWSNEYQMFCDYGYNSRQVELARVEKIQIQNGREKISHELVRKIMSKVDFDCVPELGYVTLFPLITNLLEPHNPKLGILLEYIRDESKLWSSYGVRSLSKTSSYYNKYNTEHDPPYWRGAIWLNVNYLLFKSLEHYSSLQGPYQARSKEIYIELKNNLISTVHSQYVSTNYIWENYSDLTGKGKGSHPFTGWSSLILLILLGHT